MNLLTSVVLAVAAARSCYRASTYGDAVAWTVGIQLLGSGCTRFEITRSNVHTGSILHETVGHHLANATTTSRDDYDFVLYVKEAVEAERLHAIDKASNCQED